MYHKARGSQSLKGSSNLAACLTSSSSTILHPRCSTCRLATLSHSTSGGSWECALQTEDGTPVGNLEVSKPVFNSALCLFACLIDLVLVHAEVSESVSHSVSQSISQLVTQLVSQSVSQSAISQQVTQSITKSAGGQPVSPLGRQ